MEFADYGAVHYASDADHHIDLRNPHFRQEAYLHMYQQQRADLYAQHMHHHAHYPHHLANLSVDVKPRLTKEQHDILESHYRGQNKPNTQTKKSFAETLGVSLDKVNNWFQNRRAKSKQDAKKAANQFTNDGHQGSDSSLANASSHSSQTDLNTDDISAQFLNADCLASPTPDSAISIDPMSLTNGLGISRADSSEHLSTTHSDMLPVRPVDSGHGEEMDINRRTLTQEQFDSYTSAAEYITGKPIDSTLHQSPEDEGADSFDAYLTGMDAFGGDLEPTELQQAAAAENFGSASSLFPDVTSAANDLPVKTSPRGSPSGWSDSSTPSLSITPVEHPDSGYAASDNNDISPRGKSFAQISEQWQPGQSVPCDFEAMEAEFKELAARNNPHGTNNDMLRRTSSINFADQQFAFANDQPYTQSEAPASLTQSMNNMGLHSDNTAMGHHASSSISGSISGGSIAARRQRNRPQPLSTTSMRSASFCGPLPTVPGVTAPQTAPTLRRIKSSNVMNGGIASGRIQKSISSAQRSPLNLTFAESMSAPKFARRVSSFSPANGGLGGSLAPPTPLSPTELSQRLELQRQTSQIFGARQLSRQPSINELQEESHRMGNNFASPPATPNYPSHFSRNRIVNGMISENTPPQSAPASQQCFPASIYSTPMSASYSQGSMAGGTPMTASFSQGSMGSGMMNPQTATYAPVMQTMQNQMMTQQQALQTAQYMELLQAQQQQMNTMSQLMPRSAMNMGNNLHYGMAPQQQAMYAAQNPANNIYSTFPVLTQQQHAIHHGPSKSVPDTEFFVHEYSPPSTKRLASPRKAHDNNGPLGGPKNYTFANHGPEHFEKSKKDPSGSPDSSVGSLSN